MNPEINTVAQRLKLVALEHQALARQLSALYVNTPDKMAPPHSPSPATMERILGSMFACGKLLEELAGALEASNK